MDEASFNSIKEKPFLAIMIQNNIASRPEYGLNQADIVYESLVESNITRFMAVFWSTGSEKVMSLRSARRYFVDILGDYNNPAYMHIGYAYCVPTEICDPKNESQIFACDHHTSEHFSSTQRRPRKIFFCQGIAGN